MSLYIPNVDIVNRLRLKYPPIPNGVELRYFGDALYICKVNESGDVVAGAQIIMDALPDSVVNAADDSSAADPAGSGPADYPNHIAYFDRVDYIPYGGLYLYNGGAAPSNQSIVDHHNSSSNFNLFADGDFVSVTFTVDSVMFGSSYQVLVYGQLDLLNVDPSTEHFVNYISGDLNFFLNHPDGQGGNPQWIVPSGIVVRKINESDIP